MTVVIIKIVLLFAFIHSIYAHFSFGFDDPNVDLSKSLNCYTGAYYGYSENAMNFETRRCNPGIKYCGVILHSKATNDLPNVIMRMSCEEAALHCKKSGIVDTALFVGRCCVSSLCNFK
ncbi:hypothetical protein M3Y96_00712300 [Aphelenchoides besseyi]|nr:hypothetical protein M3Y96_00712300 [Aphelenchoides besseyi]